MSDLSEMLTNLAACLCAELTPDGADGPDLCFCGLMPGQQPALDLGDCPDACGMAWVRLMDAYPAVGLGVEWDPTNNGGCGPMIGATVEVGVIRCFEQPAHGGPPEPEELLAGTQQQIEDMLAMRRAIMCCNLDDEDYALGRYAPYGPQGFIVGGWWTLDLLAG
jgi:hypothetical protein